MALEFIQATTGLSLIICDFVMIVACSAIHFLRGHTNHGTRDGYLTLLFFFVGGLSAGIFHFFRHELARQKHRSRGKQLLAILFIFVPSYYLLKWNIIRCKQPLSQTVKSWTASLMLFYCSIGSIMQAIFQSYVIVSLWWEEIEPGRIYLMVCAAIFFSLYAVYGICNYIFTQYYDEIHEHLDWGNIAIVTIAFFLSIGGRVSSMGVVMVTMSNRWELLIGPVVALLLNCVSCSGCKCGTEKNKVNQGSQDNQRGGEDSSNYAKYIYRIFFGILLAFLSTMTVSDQKWKTIVTFFLWVLSYAWQYAYYHETLSQFFVWIVPSVAQVVAVVLVSVRWEVFEAAFERFRRVARN